MQNDLTEGNLLKTMFRFSIPYLISCFLQTFYGLADLFVTGRYNGPEAITAVSVGSQLMHMVTLVCVGIAMGTTVSISRAIGAKDTKQAEKIIGNTCVVFAVFAAVMTAGLLLGMKGIIKLLAVPEEAVVQTGQYLFICFAGIVFITAYNVVSSIFRGLGDSKTPMYFVFLAGVLNVILDFILIGAFRMGACGAAIATVFSQAVSVVCAVTALLNRAGNYGLDLKNTAIKPDRGLVGDICKIGIPIAFQDFLIQVSFLTITAIANGRGVIAAASVGIVEKLISFIFLVPSAMLSTVSAITAQNAGAGKHERGVKVLECGISIGVIFGIVVGIIIQFAAEDVLSLFTSDLEVVTAGSAYFRSYVWDCTAAAIHFCFSGYFCAYRKAGLSFVQNVISIVTLRIPGAYLTSVIWPETLYPMGWAAPLGSALSAAVCVVMYMMYFKGKKKELL